MSSSNCTSGPNHIHAFFAAYPSFDYRPFSSSPPSSASRSPSSRFFFLLSPGPSCASEFRRICTHQGWSKGDPPQKKAWKDFQIALAKEFNRIYGSDAESVKAWRRLHRALGQCDGGDGVFRGSGVCGHESGTLDEVREAVLKVYANPVDLIEGFKSVHHIPTFPTESELAAYSAKTGKIIWASTPDAGALLQMLVNPRDLVFKDLASRATTAAVITAAHPNLPADYQESPGPIARFFSSYTPGFTYTPKLSPTSGPASEFRRLCVHKGWAKGDPAQKVVWHEFQEALAREFNCVYGVNVKSLVLWQRVYSRLNLPNANGERLPETLEDIQQAVFKTHFNVVDLIEAGSNGNAGRPIRIFKSEDDLAEYSRRSGKVISESSPAAGPLLLAILRRTTYGPTRVRPSKAQAKGRQVKEDKIKRINYVCDYFLRASEKYYGKEDFTIPPLPRSRVETARIMQRRFMRSLPPRRGQFS